jgi:dipeptidyl aminopeptidase/acylaminoacyl peptidase
MKSFLAALLLLATFALAQTPSQKRPFTFEDMMKLKRVGAPVPSLDGKWVVFDCVDVDLEANTRISHLWILPASGPAAAGRRLNPTPNHEERPRFSPDGKRLIWTSKATDPTQIWMCDFDSGNGGFVGKPHQLTEISTGADGGIWSPDGKSIVFVSAVYPDCKDDVCNKQRDEELKKSKVKAKIFSRLFYRHWAAFTEFKRSHLFAISADAVAAGLWPAPSPSGTSHGRLATGERLQKNEPRDLTPGDHDVPPFNLGGQDMYAISPDGQEVAYTSNIDEVEATSTNNEIFVVPLAGGTPRKISTSPGADTTPLYSPDGKYLAWRSQDRPGFEADKWRLLVQDRQSKKTRDLTEKFDRSLGSFAWAPTSNAICFAAEDHGEAPIYSVAIENDQPSEIARLHADDLTFGANGALYFTRCRLRRLTRSGDSNS